MHGRGSEQRPITWRELWPRDLPAQDLELVPKHQQLDVFHVQSAATSNKRAEQSPNGDVEEREGMPPILPGHTQKRRDTNIGALQAGRGLRFRAWHCHHSVP
jgi:hypothetical protein